MQSHSPLVKVQATKPDWRLRIPPGLILLIWLAGIFMSPSLAVAQGEKRVPVRERPIETLKLPAQEAKASPLSPKQLEEALRLLLAATADSATVPRQQKAMEIGGLVVDQTITKIGHDFYDIFYTRFEAPVGMADYVVTIMEKPGRGTSSLIIVSVNGSDLLEMPLQPKYDYVEAAAIEAVDMATGYLQEASNVSNQLEKGGRQPLETF